jgi:hypothetical protein
METRSTLDSTWSVWDSTQFPIIINEDEELEERRMGDSNFLILTNTQAPARAKPHKLEGFALFEIASKSLFNHRSTQEAAHRLTHGKQNSPQFEDYSKSYSMTRTNFGSKENSKSITGLPQSLEDVTVTAPEQVRYV